MDFEILRRFRQDRNAFGKEVGIVLDYLEEGRAQARFRVEKKHLNPNRTAHGGSLMTLADTTAGAACMYLNERISTMDLQYRFLRPCYLGDEVVAIAQAVRTGGQVVVVEVRMYRADELVGYATASFYRSHRPAPYQSELEAQTGEQ